MSLSLEITHLRHCGLDPGLTRNPLRLAKFRGSRVKPGMTTYPYLNDIGGKPHPQIWIAENNG